MKAKRRLLNELNDTIEEVKRTVATKEEELLLKEQHLDAMNKQIEELQSHLTLMEQKYKDQQSKNAGSASYINYHTEPLKPWF
jgi:predicted  nucleic acid-binding Zn-ribbon protein